MQKNQTVEEYINSFPTELQDILNKVREIGIKVINKPEETISYGIPTFKLNGKPVVYFAGYKKHISLYPIPQGDALFNKKIAPYITGKGTVQFQLHTPIPFKLIEEFIKFSLQNFNQR